MTSTVPISELNEMIGEFADLISAGMKRSVKKHCREYMLGIMIPPRSGERAYPIYLPLCPVATMVQLTGSSMTRFNTFLRRTIYLFENHGRRPSYAVHW